MSVALIIGGWFAAACGVMWLVVTRTDWLYEHHYGGPTVDAFQATMISLCCAFAWPLVLIAAGGAAMAQVALERRTAREALAREERQQLEAAERELRLEGVLR